MSRQSRPVPTLLTICDLCNEEIAEEQPHRRSSLVHGYGGYPERERATAWYLLWDPRNWPGRGEPSYEQCRDNPERWGYRHYDFHTECLLELVEMAITAPCDCGIECACATNRKDAS